MDPEVLGDLVAPSRRRESHAYRHATAPARSQSYDNLCTTTWQTANLLRLYGAHAGATVGVVDAPRPDGDRSTDAMAGRAPGTPIPEVITTFLGASLLGAVVRFDPPTSFDGSILLCPATSADTYDVGPSCTTIAYGGPPESSSVVHFESEVWSETPIAPPEDVDPDATVLETPDGGFDHTSLLSAAADVVSARELEAGDAVRIDASLANPGTVVAGVIAPLLAGGSIQVGGGDVHYVVGDDGIDPESVTPRRTDGRGSRA